jgi:hypothetical protein
VFPRLRTDREIAGYMREHVQPIAPRVADETPNKPATRLDPPAIDLRAGAQLALLETMRSDRHKALFRELREDAVINRFGLGSPGVSNTYCNTPDAEIYAATIMDRRPPTLVEVGSGFSTLIARKAVAFAQTGTRIVVYDPYPRTDVKPAADELHLAPVEQSELAERRWQAGDLLFIDSSHICRTRGDLPYLFCKVIPSLPAGVLVHVHDIFLPYDYPNLYDQWVPHRAVPAGLHAGALAALQGRPRDALASRGASRGDERRLRPARRSAFVAAPSSRLLVLVRGRRGLNLRSRADRSGMNVGRGWIFDRRHSTPRQRAAMGADFRVLIVAENASARFGGEAALPLHYYRELRARGTAAWLLTHARTRRELAEAFPATRTSSTWRTAPGTASCGAGTALPAQVRYLTTEFLSRISTQLAQRRIARRLIREHQVDVVHQPIPVSPREPSLLYGLGCPVVIGPMNGGMNYPPAFAAHEGRTERSS